MKIVGFSHKHFRITEEHQIDFDDNSVDYHIEVEYRPGHDNCSLIITAIGADGDTVIYSDRTKLSSWQLTAMQHIEAHRSL